MRRRNKAKEMENQKSRMEFGSVKIKVPLQGSGGVSNEQIILKPQQILHLIEDCRILINT